MQTLEFQLVWLMGAASSGDKDARRALGDVYPSIVAELGWDLELLRSGIINGARQDIDDGFRRLNGQVEKVGGETCTKAIIRTLRKSQMEYGCRVAGFALSELPPEKQLDSLRAIIGALEDVVKREAKPTT